eukprot:3463908-Pyramimonas_sp.AAC.1
MDVRAMGSQCQLAIVCAASCVSQEVGRTAAARGAPCWAIRRWRFAPVSRVLGSWGAWLIQAVAKRPDSPIALPSNVLRTLCGSHEMFIEHVWRSLSCFITLGY